MKTQVMNKTFEHSFDLAIALTATFLQINLLGIYDGLALKLVVFSGAATYVFRVFKEDHISTKEMLFTALTGYTFGIYISPAIVEYWAMAEKTPYVVGVHYLCGAFGMWVLSVGWELLRGAKTDGWDMVKTFFNKFFLKSDTKNDNIDKGN